VLALRPNVQCVFRGARIMRRADARKPPIAGLLSELDGTGITSSTGYFVLGRPVVHRSVRAVTLSNQGIRPSRRGAVGARHPRDGP